MNNYELVYEIIQESYDNGKITLEEAEVLNDYAYDRYITEDGHSKKLKARHNKKKRNIEKRFYDNMNFKYDHTDEKGNKHGTVKRGDGPEVDMVIHKKNLKGNTGCASNIDRSSGKYKSTINMSRQDVRQKGSDLVGSHEYSHAIDASKMKVNRNKFNKIYDKYKDVCDDSDDHPTLSNLVKLAKSSVELSSHQRKNMRSNMKKIDKDTGFDKLSKEVNKKFKGGNIHDNNAAEMRADYYALSTTAGKNNSNRLRKNLKELTRRGDQDASDDIRELSNILSNKSKKLSNKNDLKSKIKRKMADYGLKKATEESNYIRNKEREFTNRRKQVNDYIMKKRQGK